MLPSMLERCLTSDIFAGMQDSKFVCKMHISGHTRHTHKRTQLFENKLYIYHSVSSLLAIGVAYCRDERTVIIRENVARRTTGKIHELDEL